MSKFSLKRKSETVTLESEDGKEMVCEVKEMSAGDRDSYLQKLTARVELDLNGNPRGVKNFDGLQAELIGSCMFREGSRVPTEEIQQWPSSVVADIYVIAQNLNKLSQPVEDEPKNE